MALTSVNKEFHPPKNQSALGPTFLELKYDSANGDAILELYNVIGGVKGVGSEIYRNGVWTRNSTITELSEKEEVHSKVKPAIKKAADQSKGVVPPFVVNDEPSKDNQGQGNQPTPSQSNQGLLEQAGELVNALKGPPTFDVKFDSENEKKLFGTAALLRYPLNILENNQDTFQITQYNYQAPGGNVFTAKEAYKNLFTNSGLQRNSALLKDSIGTVILPMPNKVVDQNAVNWGSGDTLNSISMALGGYGYQNTLGTLLGQGIAQGGLAALEARFKIKFPPELRAGLLQALTAMDAGGGNIAGRADIRAMITSAAMKAAGLDIPAETILARGYGVVPNSNLELLFNGPTLRGFTFGYRMTPRSQKEAANVRRIIRFFKQGMAARKKSGQAGQGSAFLKSPNIFKLKYKSVGGVSISGVNKFKICALTQFGVDYTPESQWTAYEDPSSPGQPVSVIMSLQFNELEPVYESDYQESIFKGLEKDLETVTENDVGY
jgi:hypothetical protein